MALQIQTISAPSSPLSPDARARPYPLSLNASSMNGHPPSSPRTTTAAPASTPPSAASTSPAQAAPPTLAAPPPRAASTTPACPTPTSLISSSFLPVKGIPHRTLAHVNKFGDAGLGGAGFQPANLG